MSGVTGVDQLLADLLASRVGPQAARRRLAALERKMQRARGLTRALLEKSEQRSKRSSR